MKSLGRVNKDSKYFKLTISCLTLIVLLVSIGYAAFGSDFTVSNIISHIRASSSIRITDFSLVNVTGDAEAINYDYSINKLFADVKLPSLSSKAKFTATIRNFGFISMRVNSISVPEEYEDYIKVETSNGFDVGDSISTYDDYRIVTFDLEISYKDSVTILPSDVNFENIVLEFEFDEDEPPLADVTLKIYMQNRDATGAPVEGSYTQIYFIPKNSYTYNSSMTECSDGVTNIRLVNNKFAISTIKRATCSVYFSADSTDTIIGSPNALLSIFIQSAAGSENYYQVGKIPNNGHTYSLNASKTLNESSNCCSDDECSNISINNNKRQIAIESGSDMSCAVYLDIES